MKKLVRSLLLLAVTALGLLSTRALAYDSAVPVNTAGSTIVSTAKVRITGIAIDSIAGSGANATRIMLYDSATAPANLTNTSTNLIWSITLPVSPTATVPNPILLNVVCNNGAVLTTNGQPQTVTATVYKDRVPPMFGY